MATIIYYTGNGYSCSCCRQSSTDYLDFETPEDAIAECISIAASADWDFGINTIKGYNGDEYELEQQIEQAVIAAQDAAKHRAEVAQVKEEISRLENWFGNLESTKVTNQKTLEQKRSELEELTK